jgi:uncharacterized protein
MGRVEAAADADDGAGIRVTVMRSAAPRQVEEIQLRMPPGSTVQDALARCGWWQADGSASPAPSIGVWGRLQPLAHVLRDLDRVEVYRGLRVDPKEARRERYASHKQRLLAAERLAAQRKKKGPR